MHTFSPFRLLGLTALLLLGRQAQAQTPSPFRQHALAPRTEAYQPLPGTATAINAIEADEATSADLPIGFDFKLAGGSYTTVVVSSNGWLSLADAATVAGAATPANSLDAAPAPILPLVAPLWDDLNGTGGTASYHTTGTAPNRVFAVEWRNWQWQAANISFQVRLYEGSGRVEFAYQGGAGAAVAGSSASIGLVSGTRYLSVSSTGPAPGLTTNGTGTPPAQAVPGGPANNAQAQAPANGQVYALLPPAPAANDERTGASALPVSATGVCAATTGNLFHATRSTTAPLPTCASFDGEDLWYAIVVPASGALTVATNPGDGPGDQTIDTGLTVYSLSGGTLTEVGCDDDGGFNAYSLLNLTGLTAGSTVYARVYSYAGGELGLFSVCASDPSFVPSPNDLIIANGTTYVSGTFRNITVTGTGRGILTGAPGQMLTISGALVVQSGGSLDLKDFIIDGAGSFALQPGGRLAFQNTRGLLTTGFAGPVQTLGTRTFGADADYVFTVENSTAVTGAGFPSQVRSLEVLEIAGAGGGGGGGGRAGNLNLNLSGPLTITRKLQLEANLDVNTQLLTLRSTPTETALVENAGGLVVGPVTVQRAISGSRNAGAGYRHFTSPVVGSTVTSLGTATAVPVINAGYNLSATPGTTVPFPTVYGYDESRLATTTNNLSAFDKGWFAPAALGTLLTVGRGYTVNLGAANVLNFVGTLNAGARTVTLSRGASAGAGLHLLGNPYPSPLDWSRVTPPAGLSGALYVFESSSQYAGVYRSYINGIGNPVVPLGQGFFVRQSGSAGPSIDFTFEDAMRVTDPADATTLHRTAEVRPLVQLGLQNAAGTLHDAATLYFEAGATAAPTDARFDAAKIRNVGGEASVFTLGGSQELAIDGRAPLAAGATLTVPLGLAVPTAGPYVLAADALRNLVPAGLANVALLDRATGIQTALRPGTRYPFNLATSELTSLGRFALVFNPGAAPLATATGLAAQIGLYPNPAHGRFTLSLPALAGTAAVQATLRNALGQAVQPTRTLPLTGTGTVADFDTQALPPGVYLLQIQAPNQPALTKRVVVE